MQNTVSLDQIRLYEDEDILVVSKPAGMVTNDAASVQGSTIQSLIREYVTTLPVVEEDIWKKQVPADFDDQYGSPLDIFVKRAGMVHRLDKDTSGVVVLAKHPGSLVHLLRQFRLRQVRKEYLCLVHGIVSPAEGVVDAPIDRSRRDRKKFAVADGGRKAVTEYVVEDVFNQYDLDRLLPAQKMPQQHQRAERTYQGFSLVRCFPKTGRTHQIRVHMAHLQHPLVGDTTYAGKKRAKLDPIWCPRQFLHAAQITFQHPRTGDKVEVSAPLSEDLELVLSLLTTS